MKIGERASLPNIRNLLVAGFSVVYLTFAGPVSAQSSVNKLEFPRLAGINIGSPTLGPWQGYQDPRYHDALARLDLVILGIWPGWGPDGWTPDEVLNEIKQRNPDILVGNYTNVISVHSDSAGDSLRREKAASETGPNSSNAHDWFARDNSGNLTSTWSGTYSINHTEYVQPDINGDRYLEWVARQDYERWFKNPDWDIWYSDSVWWKPRTNADWSGGKETDSARIQAAYRRGHVAHWDKIRELRPDVLIMPNVDWANTPPDVSLPEYQQQVGSALLEHIMGVSWSSETWGGWNAAMRFYRDTKKMLTDPGIVLFNVTGNPTDYQFLRYAFATCVLDDGYFSFSPNDEGLFSRVVWFDEYDLAGAGDTSWLGRAVSSPPTAAWKDGVHRRDFEHGVVLVNPKGNGPKTVSLEPGLRTFLGTQDPQTNSGQAVSTISLADRDGILLVRESSASISDPPKPPIVVLD